MHLVCLASIFEFVAFVAIGLPVKEGEHPVYVNVSVVYILLRGSRATFGFHFDHKLGRFCTSEEPCRLMKLKAWRVWTHEIGTTSKELGAHLTGRIWVTNIFIDVIIAGNGSDLLLLSVIV